MSTPTDEKLLSLLHKITTEPDLELPRTDESNDIDNVIAEENAYSKKRSQEFLLTEMEQKLEIAEINFGTLKQQLDYMKMLYTDIHRESDKLEKHRKDRQKKKPQSKVKNICKTLPVRRRFSSASVHKAKSTVSEKFKPLNHKTVTYTTAASNTDDIYTAPESQSAKSKTKSPRKSESETQHKLSPIITCSETPPKEKEDLEELNSEPTVEEQNSNLFQVVCNQGQQTEPLEVSSAHKIKQDFWYGYAEDANQMLEQCVHMNENFIEEDNKTENQQESLSCEPTEEEIEYTVLISGNSKNSTNNSLKASGKKEAYPKLMYPENRKKANKKSKGKTKKSVSQSTISTINPIFEGSYGINKPKRKPKGHGGNIEKKRKSTSKTSIQARHIKPRITETVISVTTKTKNKNTSKMKLLPSRNTIGNKKEKVHSRFKLSEEQPTVSYDEVPVSLKPNTKLVELYHNENVNVNISEENVPESGTNAPTSNILSKKSHNNVLPESSKKLSARHTDRKEQADIKSYQNETSESKEIKLADIPPTPPAPTKAEKEILNMPEETKTVNLSEPYVQPKGATKFKYFKRNYYKRLNFKKIPFVAGTSTSPSHNLGLNIQQVLSIIKMKQPRFKDNIASHTQVVESSTFLQHTVHRRTRSICPAKMHSMLAEDPEKEVSDEVEAVNSKTTDITPNTTNGLLFGLTNKVKRPEDVWVVDQDNAPRKLRCTCVPSRRCTDYQQLLIEYLEKGGGDVSFLNRKYSAETYPHFPSAERRFRSHFSAVDKAMNQEVPRIMNSSWDMEQSSVSGNNKKLARMDLPQNGCNVKGVLSHLHDDFNRLNTHYKQLQNGLNKDLVDKEKKLELQKLEKALQAKEHEINMIMDLYKEVSILKQHMKNLRVHNEHSSLSISSPSKINSIPYFGSKGPTPSLRLTKLLRIMQQFQYRLRQVSDVNSRSLCFYHCFMINIE